MSLTKQQKLIIVHFISLVLQQTSYKMQVTEWRHNKRTGVHPPPMTMLYVLYKIAADIFSNQNPSGWQHNSCLSTL